MEPRGWLLVGMTVVIRTSLEICPGQRSTRPSKFDSRLPPLSPFWPKVNITQRGHDSHPNHSTSTISASQGCSNSTSNSSDGLTKGSWRKKRCGLRCCNTWNINTRARTKEMAQNQPHYLPTKRRSSNHAESTSRDHRQHIFNGGRNVSTYLRPFISAVLPSSFSSVLPRSIVWWYQVYGRYRMR